MRSIPGPRGSHTIRFAPAVLIAGFVFVAAVSMVARPVAAAPSPGASARGGTGHAVRTVAQDGRGATFDVVPGPARFDSINVDGALYARVSLPGAVVLEQPGKPALPTLSLYVAVPDGMSPRLRVTAEDWEDRAGLLPLPVVRQRFLSDAPDKGPQSELKTEPDPAVYRGGMYPLDVAALGSGALVGEWWVAPVRVHPVRWDPRGGTYRLLRKMTLRVDFVPATNREITGRPAARPGAQSRTWDRLQRGFVQNYEAARSFSVRPRAGSLGAAPFGISRAGSRFTTSQEWKISIGQTGWVSVPYTALTATGFPSRTPISNVRIEERGYDDTADTATVAPIPMVARDANANDTLDVGDAITFYARSLRDRVGLVSIENRYASNNVYWLTLGNGPTAIPGTVSGNIPGAATIPNSFREVIRLDVNQFIDPAPSSSAASPPEAVEHYFWTNGQEPSFSVPITFQDPDQSQPFRIRSRYQGINGSGHTLNLFFSGAGGALDTISQNETFFNQDVQVFDSGFTIPGAHIGGANEYRHVGQHQSDFGGPVLPGSAAYFDVLEVTYSRLYKASSNMLRFTSGGSGLMELHLSGFTAPGVRIYDVTDPIQVLQVTDLTITPNGGSYDVVFRTDATSGDRKFVALVPGAEPSVGTGSIAQDVPSNLRLPSAFPSGSLARSVVVAPRDFQVAANRFADLRRSQGYVVECALIDDIYDEFNGGIKSARALRRYLRHAYLTWAPRITYAVLAGDGSMDYEHVNEASSTDWIPTYLRFETIIGPRGEELVAQDSYYSLNLAAVEPIDGDFTPSIFLGRIPVSSNAELDAFVTKVATYESYSPLDTWRGRQLLVSDDDYSTTIFGTGSYCLQPQEVEFRAANQYMADAAAVSPGAADIASDFFDLKQRTDSLAQYCPGSGPNCRDISCITSHFRSTGGAVDEFHAQLAQGALILNIESHANRYLIAHEILFCSGPPGCSYIGDYDMISNYNKPAYMMMWGCHANQFADGPVGIGAIDSSDAFGEQWMLLPNRGSIASFGSSAYEFLQTNAVYNQLVANAFYLTPPSVDQGGRPESRWILGEVMGEAAIQNALTGSFAQQVMNRNAIMLGDPMLRMDALPPRVADVTVAGVPFTDNAALTTDSPTDSLAITASLRDEVGIDSVYLTEQDIATSVVTPIDPATFSVTFSDSSRVASLSGNVRPHVGNYDLQIRAVDVNGRLRTFTMQVRTPIRYLANGIDIVNGVFVQNGSTLRVEVTSPIPLTIDSLSLRIDGIPVAATISKIDTPGRQWALEFVAADLFTGSHTIAVAINGRTFDQRTFEASSEFTLRGVAVVDPRIQGAGCGGSIFQYELSAVARKVELLLFTVAGRRVASIDLPGQAGFNVFCWDGRDSRGHDTAQGVYLFRIRATDTSGKTVMRDGRMIRAR